jgi:hypothetical protein
VSKSDVSPQLVDTTNEKMTPAFAEGSVILSFVAVAIAALHFFVSVAAAFFLWEISK